MERQHVKLITSNKLFLKSDDLVDIDSHQVYYVSMFMFQIWTVELGRGRQKGGFGGKFMFGIFLNQWTFEYGRFLLIKQRFKF